MVYPGRLLQQDKGSLYTTDSRIKDYNRGDHPSQYLEHNGDECHGKDWGNRDRDGSRFETTRNHALVPERRLSPWMCWQPPWADSRIAARRYNLENRYPHAAASGNGKRLHRRNSGYMEYSD